LSPHGSSKRFDVEFRSIAILEIGLFTQDLEGIHSRVAQMPVAFCQTLIFFDGGEASQ
jgi:hypothetical protein